MGGGPLRGGLKVEGGAEERSCVGREEGEGGREEEEEEEGGEGGERAEEHRAWRRMRSGRVKKIDGGS